MGFAHGAATRIGVLCSIALLLSWHPFQLCPFRRSATTKYLDYFKWLPRGKVLIQSV